VSIPISDQDLADEIIQRLNVLIDNPGVREFVTRLIQAKVGIDLKLAEEHQTIQCWAKDGKASCGFLGMLNGIVGFIGGNSDISNYGYITAKFDNISNELVRFVRTEEV
jgi:hypothetical protein